VLADMKPVSLLQAEEQLVQAVAAERDRRRTGNQNTGKRAKGN
jgi:hypothetical protein